MQRVLDWLKRKGDVNVVAYSRFGLPGEETDDRPPPTTICVAPFHDDAKQFLVFGTHAQRAAVLSAGVGVSATVFIFLSVFFEFDWYHHVKGVDIGALLGLLLFLAMGVMVHWYVIRGIKLSQPKFLVPFIIVYAALIFIELIFMIFAINHWIALSYISNIQTREPGAFILLLITFGIVIVCQGGMLFSVVRCRNYLEMKSIHELEMRVVEKSKQQHPGIRIVYGPVEINGPSVGIATQSFDGPSAATAPTQNGVATSSPPPSYEASTAPQRTILQGHEEV